ncbi:MAG: ribonuclease III [Lachnospiraceae bacterium]|nr:ribonuclease III [Lachnospiraceae bacterium]
MNSFQPEEVEKRIGYTFQDRTLLRSALAHSSFTNELKINQFPDYERLEFLGDAVLELTVSDFLYRTKHNMPEGEMTKLRSSLVCEPTLAFCARAFSLSDFILLGKGEEAQGSRNRDSIVSDVFEALIGAIYLDGGIEKAKNHIHKFLLSDIEGKSLFYDAKSTLQTKVQKAGGTIEYEVTGVSGPDHKREYTVTVYINGQAAGKGSAGSKKGAEQQAAYEVLRRDRE